MSPLLIAIYKNNVPLAELYIECPRCDLNIANYYGQTPLLLAIENCNIEMLRALLHEYRRLSIESDVIIIMQLS